MDGTDEVGIAGELGDSDRTYRVWAWQACWGFGRGLVSQKLRCWWRWRMPLSVKTPLLYPHQEYVIRSPGLSDLLL
ncbi:hypothetical protein [Microcoleus sp. S13_C5]|uniref:hypothetical protein n=1 Tax=Microcoleus sp. S13_C5 TaxID=3055411 RepID=UPI002FCF045F